MSCVPGIISEHHLGLPIPHLIFDYIVSKFYLTLRSGLILLFQFPFSESTQFKHCFLDYSEQLEMKRGFTRGFLGPCQLLKSLFSGVSLVERTHVVVEGSVLTKMNIVARFKY